MMDWRTTSAYTFKKIVQGIFGLNQETSALANSMAGVFLFDGSKLKNITQEAAVLGAEKKLTNC